MHGLVLTWGILPLCVQITNTDVNPRELVKASDQSEQAEHEAFKVLTLHLNLLNVLVTLVCIHRQIS